jgi:hypothetical protein
MYADRLSTVFHTEQYQVVSIGSNNKMGVTPKYYETIMFRGYLGQYLILGV